jgi:hypothetical protein
MGQEQEPLSSEDLHLLKQLSEGDGLMPDEKAMVGELMRRSGPQFYAEQHPVENAINKVGDAAQSTLPYNPATYVFKGIGAGLDAANDYLGKRPLGSAINGVLGEAKKGYQDLQDVADQNQADNGFTFGRAGITPAVNDPLNSMLRAGADVMGSLTPGNLGELGALFLGPSEVAAGAKGLYNAAKEVSPSAESILSSKLGRLGGGNIPFDEVKQKASMAARNIAEQKAAAEALKAQKAGVEDWQNSIIEKLNQTQEPIENAAAHNTKLTEIADKEKESLNKSLDAVDTTQPRPRSVGMFLQDQLEEGQSSAKKDLNFASRYQRIRDNGNLIAPSQIPEVLNFATDKLDDLRAAIPETGNAVIKRILKGAKDIATEEGGQDAPRLLDSKGKVYSQAKSDVGFNELLDAQKAVRRAISRMYDPKTNTWKPQVNALRGLDAAMQQSLERMSTSTGIFEDLKNTNADYQDYKQTFGDAFKSLRYASDPESTLAAALKSETNQIHLEKAGGPEAIAAVKKYQSQSIMKEVVDSVRRDGNPVAVVEGHLSKAENDSLFNQAEKDELLGRAQDFKDKMDRIKELEKGVSGSEDILSKLRESQDRALKDIPGEPGVPDKKIISSQDRRSGDQGQNLGRRSSDRTSPERIADFGIRHASSIGGAGLAVLTHHPAFIALGAALNYGPEVLARMYIKSGPAREAIDNAIQKMGKGPEYQKALGRVATYASVHRLFDDKRK